MRIGICGPFNPQVIADYLDSGQSIPNINYTASAVNTLVREMVRKGHSVYVFTTTYDKCKTIVLKGQNIKIYICSTAFISTKMAFFSRLYEHNRLARCIQLEIMNLDVLHAHWTYEYALAAIKFKEILPVFCTVRDWCPYILSIQTTIKTKLYWWISLQVFKRVISCKQIQFIANSKYVFDLINLNFPSIQPVIIHNPIAKEYIIEKKYKCQKNLTFITIATNVVDRRKNIETLLEAFKIFLRDDNDSKLIVIGGSATREDPTVKKWESKGLLNNVSMCGLIDHKDLMSYIDSASCLIHPALEETFGNTLIEGMARAIPIIGGVDSGAVPYVLGEGKYGILCDVKNPLAIYEAMTKIKDYSYVTQLVNRATQNIVANYASDQILNIHLQLYNKFIH